MLRIEKIIGVQSEVKHIIMANGRYGSIFVNGHTFASLILDNDVSILLSDNSTILPSKLVNRKDKILGVAYQKDLGTIIHPYSQDSEMLLDYVDGFSDGKVVDIRYENIVNQWTLRSCFCNLYSNDVLLIKFDRFHLVDKGQSCFLNSVYMSLYNAIKEVLLNSNIPLAGKEIVLCNNFDIYYKIHKTKDFDTYITKLRMLKRGI